ncbi:MAG TPA: TolC family protein, partial [Opitutales bacterium]|nr:TolC family protein [Opitutales bacterium]
MEPIRLSLGDLFVRVESENLEVLLNRETVEQAVVAAQRERASLLPRIDLEASQVRSQFVNIGRGFEIPGFPGGIPSVGPSNRFDGRLTGSISLVDPVLIASFRAAKIGIEVSEFEQQRILQEVLDSAAMVYLAHLRNLERFEVIEADIERDRALLELTIRQRDVGVVTEIDVTRAEVQLAATRQAHLQQETAVLESELFLKRLLNLDLRAPLELTGFIASRFLPVEGQPVEVETVLEDLPDYLRAQAQLDRNRLERKAAAWERFPI